MSQRPIVVREKAVEHRAKSNRQAMLEVLPEWERASVSERYKLVSRLLRKGDPYPDRFSIAARLLPLQTLLGNLALIAWLVFIALTWSGHITVQ